LRNERNSKQTHCKNRGKAAADTPYVYFGDDDSVLAPGSMASLLETSEAMRADIVGAVAIYCRPGQSIDDALREYRDQEPTSSSHRYVDLRRLRFCFNLRPAGPMQLPITQAAFLIRREWYGRVSFDTRYTGNCYREETDFLLSCARGGAKIWLDGRAMQVNLPPDVATGGARAGGRLRYEWYSLVNTFRFLRKHRSYYEKDLGVWHVAPLFTFICDRIAAGMKRMVT
jgi:hypothetical protein